MIFSFIITVHDEGIVADKTMQSVFRAIEGFALGEFEIIVHIDNGSAETLDYFERYRVDNRVRLLKNHFGDVGPARNYAVQKAKGKYVFIVDGDDLVSCNYIREILEILEGDHGDVVVHPEYCIGFGDEATTGSILKMQNSSTRERDAYRLLSVNLWAVPIAGRREIFLTHPYIETAYGYGHEDYALNIDLVASGVRHRVAPGTAYFYREKAVSRRRMNDTARHVTPYSELFAPELWRSFDVQETDSTQREAKSWRGRLKQAYLKVSNNRVLAGVFTPMMLEARNLIGKRLLKRELPDVVRIEWQQAAELEPKLARKGKKINAMGIRGVNPFCPVSTAYLEICRSYPGWSVIDFRSISSGLDAEQKDLLMSRVMVQSRGKASFLDEQDLKAWKTRHPELTQTLLGRN